MGVLRGSVSRGVHMQIRKVTFTQRDQVTARAQVWLYRDRFPVQKNGEAKLRLTAGGAAAVHANFVAVRGPGDVGLGRQLPPVDRTVRLSDPPRGSASRRCA